MKKRSIRAICEIIPLLILFTIGTFRANAQDEPAPSDMDQQDAAEEGAEVPESEDGLSEGILKGAYWWTDINPVAISALADFGIDAVAIRLGKLSAAVDQPGLALENAQDISALSDLPASLRFRLVIETDETVWREGNRQALPEWLSSDAAEMVESAGIDVMSIEVLLPSSDDATRNTPSVDTLAAFLEDLEASEIDIPVEVGMNAGYFAGLSPLDNERLARIAEGVVVYFMDYDYSSVSPRITDRAWIDATSAELARVGIPFTVVLPVFNRAILYEQTSAGGTVLPAVDLASLISGSDVRPMGSAGTEYVITQPVESMGAALSEGDRIRVIESLREIDLGSLIDGLPRMAPNCREIDLYRFPLVPGFDPAANEVLTAAGWLGSPATVASDELDLEKEKLDSKHGQAQQIIWMITLALMLVVLMRMFSKGAGQQQGTK